MTDGKPEIIHVKGGFHALEQVPVDHHEMLEAVARGESYEAAARLGGMTGRNLYHKMKLPHYRQYVKEWIDSAWGERLRRAAKNFDLAELTFLEILSDKENPPFIRLQAAIQLKQIAMKANEIMLQDEMDAIRKQVEELKEVLESRGK